MQEWERLQPRVAELTKIESGAAETIQLRNVPEEHTNRLKQVASDPLFQNTFSNLRTAFAMVEIDKLIAAQRTVNLDYVDRLLGSAKHTRLQFSEL
jgi:hypothetical protein